MGLKNPSIYAKILAFSVLGLLVLGGMGVLATQNANAKVEKNLGMKQRAVHAPIHITSNSEFTQENGVVGGSGTQDDPYIIEGWEIDGNGGTYCISIENTIVYFTIRNCYVSNSQYGIALINVRNGGISNNNARHVSDYGIYLEDSNYNTISNNNISDNPGAYGIFLHSSSSNIIANNSASGNDNCIYLESDSDYNSIINNNACGNTEGIHLWGSDYNTILNNNVSDNYYGINLESSSYNTIANNNASENLFYGIWLSSSNCNNITNNNASGNSHHGIWLWVSSNSNTLANNNASGNSLYGIFLDGSAYNNIINNTMWGCGIVIWDGESTHSIEYWNTHNIDTTNLVNGKPVYYYKNQNGGTVPANAGQVILANCSNMVIEGLNIINASIGIQLGFSSTNKISNSTLTGNSEGFCLYSSSNNTITNNNASGNYGSKEAFGGGPLDGVGIALYSSTNNTIGNNKFCGNGEGIFLSSSCYNNIRDNNASGNGYTGIYLEKASNSNMITNNNASGNFGNGIYLYSSSNNTITSNWFCANTDYGAYVRSSTANIIHHNNFIGNNGAGKAINGNCQAYDNVGSNSWHDNTTREGNYWSNWDGNGWGSADAYPIDGNAGASDWYPLTLPEISMVLERTEIEGKKDNILNATIVVKRGGFFLPNILVTVTFDKSGLSATTGMTAQNGTAIVTITLTEDFQKDTTVSIVPRATINGTEYNGVPAALTIKGVSGENINVNLELASTEVAGITGAEITATVTVMNGSTPVPNVDVRLVLNPTTGLSAETGKKTDTNGKATIKITVTQDFSADTTLSVKAVATISGKTYESASGTLTVKYVPYNITLTLEPVQIEGKKDNKVTATVKVMNGSTPLSNISVTLTATPSTNIQITPANAMTDANGSAKFTITLTADFSNDATISIMPKATIDWKDYTGVSKTLTIKKIGGEAEATKTPGFEFLAVMAAIALVAGISAYARRKEH